MTFLVANGAKLQCSLGSTPSALALLPGPPHLVTAAPPPAPLAVVADVVPQTNILPFGMCSSPANPAVQAATAAASGVFTPAPCVPATETPWSPPARVLISGVAAFDQKATCQCQWQGTVTVLSAGQVNVLTGP
jgi:Domain of unknown function (DUF4280)